MATTDPGRPAFGSSWRPSRWRRVLFTAPTPAQSTGVIAVEGLAIGAILLLPGTAALPFLVTDLLVFLLPAILGAAITTPLAGALGGRLALRRSLFLSATTLLLVVPLALGWRLALLVDAAAVPPTAALFLFLQGPILWFREMSLFGVSNPSHRLSGPPALVQPLLAIVGIFLLGPPTVALLVEAALFLLIGFAAAALLLRAADRPIRREFGSSGVGLIRPMLDHINERDPAATNYLEEFFERFAIPADIRVTLLGFRTSAGMKATIALPTVHPGPFASLGSSDLPRRLGERLGPSAGVVLVPHTPCNHDLDLPTAAQFDRLASESQHLLGVLADGTARGPVSPLVSGSERSFARAQIVGDAVLVVVTQAPEPTDDIELAVVDPVARALEKAGGPRVALIDAHNSYIEDQGDLSYGTPRAEKLAHDIEASVERARFLAQRTPVRVGTSVRDGYSTVATGIGPHGIRSLVIDGAGRKTAYVLIDGNNLVVGMRGLLLDALKPIVDDAEILTTDNHIVHEVDGGTNPVGERYPSSALVADVRASVEAAVADLTEVKVTSGVRRIPSIRVLQPGWTIRLLTSLSDTLSFFSDALLMTFLLVLTTSLVVLLALR